MCEAQRVHCNLLYTSLSALNQTATLYFIFLGKTTLARALSGDCKLEPEDKLFATLDTTVHRGKLPCGMGVLFIDTVGFITDLPHDLIQSFSATLEDVKNAVRICFDSLLSFYF